MLWILLIIVAVGALGAITLGDTGTIAGLDGDIIASIVALVAILAFVASGTVRDYAGRWAAAGRDIAIWLSIALVLMIGYVLRDELRPLYNRVAGEFLPPGRALNVSTGGERAVQIRKRGDGHFVVVSEVNSVSVRMLVDTGASRIVLTSDDARRVGIDVKSLAYTIPVQTANGTGFAAIVTLRSLSVGGIDRRELEAFVAKPGALRESLLGMNFLKQLRSYEFTRDYVTFRG